MGSPAAHVMPIGCTCDPVGWFAIRPVCECFEPDPEFSNCLHCEHDAACHTPAAVRAGLKAAEAKSDAASETLARRWGDR